MEMWDEKRAGNGILENFDLCSDCSVQLQSNSRGRLHRMCPRKRHQMRHLCDLRCLLAKQVLSQLSYSPLQLYDSSSESNRIS
jgi:hypothetical protein